ncbi:arsenate reductase/protein-tyrosine-phosphatase family protein [Gulosibacter chungangensis]|uniref:Low molecular weight phosphatase family protein n=1 Tax=Gulosibacter chungangensis TaxID=979746 RepID=A0A7J5B8T5_9MICO|nr:low molecular weight phosphatase family protein [Gulosibacter chungangensis]KAB1641679.1 low molecular weight phosphatase family protein [Gulosibacter chungangensis]
MAFKLLTVCTGNICRSPYAELLLREKLDASRFEVDSAGTGALVGHPMPDELLEIAARNGIEGAPEHRGQQLTEELIVDSDLIFALSREHRSQVVQMHPRANRYTFTLIEFARIARAIPEDELREGVAGRRNVERAAFQTLSELRGIVPPPESQSDLDITDPYRREFEVYEASAQAITGAVSVIVAYFQRARWLSTQE